jgi:competence protein ComEA
MRRDSVRTPSVRNGGAVNTRQVTGIEYFRGHGRLVTVLTLRTMATLAVTPRHVLANLRIDRGRNMKSRIQLVLGIAVISAILVAGLLVWVDRMQPVTISIGTVAEERIQVSIGGAVATPGVVEVPVGARLQQVVDLAGGFATDADVSLLNLAGRVGDGEHIEIPSIGGGGSDQGLVPAASGVELIDINTAGIAELDELPGIGDVLAGRIIDYRETNGPFTSVDQLADIEGISPRLVDQIRPFVTISDGS